MKTKENFAAHIKRLKKILHIALIYFIAIPILSSCLAERITKDPEANLLGINFYAVASDSMSYVHKDNEEFLQGQKAGFIFKGDLVVLKNRGANEPITVGQIVAVDSGNYLILHRVVKISQINGSTIYYTKGDANNITDLPVTSQKIKAVFLFKVPLVGFVPLLLKTKAGVITVLFVILLKCVISYAEVLKKEKLYGQIYDLFPQIFDKNKKAQL